MYGHRNGRHDKCVCPICFVWVQVSSFPDLVLIKICQLVCLQVFGWSRRSNVAAFFVPIIGGKVPWQNETLFLINRAMSINRNENQ